MLKNIYVAIILFITASLTACSQNPPASCDGTDLRPININKTNYIFKSYIRAAEQKDCGPSPFMHANSIAEAQTRRLQK